MSKIICDICGTSYPDTATQCPICGCVRPGDIVTVSSAAGAPEGQPGSNYVKGGRFSKANVKKRNKGKVYLPEDSLDMDERMGDSRSNRGIIIALILLIVAIVAVVGYIVFQLLAKDDQPASGTSVQSTIIFTEPSEPTVQPTDVKDICTDIKVSAQLVELKKGQSRVLNVKVEPADTTLEMTVESSNEDVAVVTGNGKTIKVTAVGPGSAVITITCGDVVKECAVFCKSEGDETKATEPSDPEIPVVPFELTTTDFTVSRYGEEVLLYTGNIPADQIQWSSSDPSQVEVDANGRVKVVGYSGTDESVIITAVYGGVSYKCTVRCNSKGAAPTTENSPEEEKDDYTVSIDRTVTLKVGESVSFTVINADGVDITNMIIWEKTYSSVVSIADGVITGVAASNGPCTVNGTVPGGFPFAFTVTVEAEAEQTPESDTQTP